MGKDSKINNLFHNLGSGQAMKYTPILGEALAEDIIGEKDIKKFDYEKFNINRFGESIWRFGIVVSRKHTTDKAKHCLIIIFSRVMSIHAKPSKIFTFIFIIRRIKIS